MYKDKIYLSLEKKTEFQPSSPPDYENFLLIQLDSKQAQCVGGRHKCNTIGLNEYENIILETQKLWKLEEENVMFVVVAYLNFF